MSLAARPFLDLGGVKQSGDDGGRADADRHTCLHQLVAALLVGFFDIVVAVVHNPLSMAFGASLEAA
jgi:hypothetical protein